VPAPSGAFDAGLVRGLRRRGVNALLLDVARLNGIAAFDRVRSVARSLGMLLVPVLAQRSHSAVSSYALDACRVDPSVRCAALAPSLTAARHLAAMPDSTRKLVVIGVSGPRTVTQLRFAAHVRQVVVMAPLGSSFDAASWHAAVAHARTGSFGLAVSAVS